MQKAKQDKLFKGKYRITPLSFSKDSFKRTQKFPSQEANDSRVEHTGGLHCAAVG